jgi:hypothetical protein
MRNALFSSLLFTAAFSSAAAAQDKIANAGLPRAVEERLMAIVNNPATRQITGSATISENIDGDVVAYDGPLTITGRINGELIVVDANVEFREGSEVTGDVTLVGGEAVGIENANIGGTVTMYTEGFSLFRGREKVFSVNSRSRRAYREDWRRDYGHSEFRISTGWNYNRVEGLPVHFGPVIEAGGSNPTRFEALAIWRTEVSSPWDTEDLGYTVRAEQFLGGARTFRIGGSFHSVVDPIEKWQMRNTEASLAAFVLHDDYRDYYKREGWSAYARFAPRASGLSITAEYRDDEHRSEAARDPWTLFDNSDAWRLQPLVAEGELRSINGSIELDRRDDDDFATAGFLLRADVNHGLGGNLRDVATGFGPMPFIPGNYDERFTNALIDARVYRRIGMDATLSFRFVGAGALSDHALPPQFQHALGGAGSLPGYAAFSADCGARDFPTIRREDEQAFFPYYGCDRIALFSAEYRGGFDFHWGGLDAWDEDDDWDWDVDASPNWVVFFDAARGWSHDSAKERGAVDTNALYDVGAGLLLGDFGIYGAVPLTGEDRGLRFFIRLGARF